MAEVKTAASTPIENGREYQECTGNFAQTKCAHKSEPKYRRTLRALLESPKNSFELEKAPTFDYCANSTVSELKKRYGLDITAQLIRLPGYDGRGVYVAEYRIADGSRQRALRLIGAG